MSTIFNSCIYDESINEVEKVKEVREPRKIYNECDLRESRLILLNITKFKN